jgi:hypothetical protein
MSGDDEEFVPIILNNKSSNYFLFFCAHNRCNKDISLETCQQSVLFPPRQLMKNLENFIGRQTD